MKKWYVVGLLLVIAGMVFGIDVSAGPCVDGHLLSQSVSDPSYKETYRFADLGVGAFIDLKFIKLSAQYVFTVSDPEGLVYYDGEQDYFESALLSAAMTGMVSNYLAVAALVKFPIRVGTAKMAPAVGAEYMLNLAFKQEGIDLKEGRTQTDKRSLNDIVALAGISFAFNIGKKGAFLGLDVLGGYNLTPNFFPDAIGPGYDFSGWTVRTGLSLGFPLASP